MLDMLAIDRFYRHAHTIEEIQRLDEQIAAIAETLYRIEEGPELDHLNAASRALRLAVKSLHEAKVTVRVQCQEALLEGQLKMSLELVNTSPERMRARQNGEPA